MNDRTGWGRHAFRARGAALALAVAACWGLLLSHFSPSLLLLDTMTAGGDTPSFQHPIEHLRDVLLPAGNPQGWDAGNFGGYAPYQYYFLPPSLAVVVLAKVMPFNVAFKLVSVAGTFLLPLTTALALRALGLLLFRAGGRRRRQTALPLQRGQYDVGQERRQHARWRVQLQSGLRPGCPLSGPALPRRRAGPGPALTRPPFGGGRLVPSNWLHDRRRPRSVLPARAWALPSELPLPRLGLWNSPSARRP